MVRLLKLYYRPLTFIFLSGEESLPLKRSMSTEGIFYHTQKPADRFDTEEIRLAVEYAFKKPESSN